MLTTAQAEALAELCSDYPGVKIRTTGDDWTAETSQMLLSAATPADLRELLDGQRSEVVFARTTALLRMLDT
jgi:hypothetical protein